MKRECKKGIVNLKEKKDVQGFWDYQRSVEGLKTRNFFSEIEKWNYQRIKFETKEDKDLRLVRFLKSPGGIEESWFHERSTVTSGREKMIWINKKWLR